jgi:hypothetical protein
VVSKSRNTYIYLILKDAYEKERYCTYEELQERVVDTLRDGILINGEKLTSFDKAMMCDVTKLVFHNK